MATQRIDLTLSSPVVQQMYNMDISKTNDSSKIVDISTATSRLVTTTAPRLEPAKDPNFTKAYEAFMILIAEWETFLMNALNKLNQIETGMGKTLLALAQTEVKKAQENEQAVIKAQEEAAHQSFWSKFAGYFVAAFALVITALTGGATAFLLAAAVTAVMLSPASQKLEEALQNAGLTPAEIGLVQLAIVIVTAAALSAGAGMLSTTGEEVGEAEGQSLSEKAASGVKSNMLGYSAQMLMIFNPIQNFTEAFLEATGTGKDKAKLIAMIVGIVVSILAMVVSMKAGTSGEVKDVGPIKSLKNYLGPNGMSALINILRILRAGANITSGAFNIMVYKTKQHVAGLQEAVGTANQNLTIYKNAAQIESDLANQGSDQYNKEMQLVELMISNESRIIEPYDVMAKA